MTFLDHDEYKNLTMRIPVHRAMEEKEVDELFEKLMHDFGNRHRDILKIFSENFDKWQAEK